MTVCTKLQVSIGTLRNLLACVDNTIAAKWASRDVYLIENISHKALFWIIYTVLYLYFMLQRTGSFNFLVFLSLSLSLRSGKMGLSHL